MHGSTCAKAARKALHLFSSQYPGHVLHKCLFFSNVSKFNYNIIVTSALTCNIILEAISVETMQGMHNFVKFVSVRAYHY